MRVGFLTIGQSPRHDILKEILPLIPNVTPVEAGALDNISDEQIMLLKPEKKDEMLVSRLRDGRQVILGKKKLIPLLNDAVVRLHSVGAKIAFLLCTSTFDFSSAPIPVIQPGRIMRNLIGLLLSNEGKLGLVVPLEDQKQQITEVWKRFVRDIKVITLSPYRGHELQPRELEFLKDRDLIVMDCMGYRLEHERLIRRHTKRPVLLPKRLIPLLLKEFYQL
ncbi:MAG: hypothetical protein DRN90_03220 [Thermoproteota archaeon]|nr:MAG: hypothetical protein DRN90_03220 [Candidatus Korarchaeota archaeon]